MIQQVSHVDRALPVPFLSGIWGICRCAIKLYFLQKMKVRDAGEVRSHLCMEAVRLGFLSSVFIWRSKVVTPTRYEQLQFPFLFCVPKGSYLAVSSTSKTKSLPLADGQHIFRLGSAFCPPSTRHVYFYSALIPSKLHQSLFPGKPGSEKCLRGGKKWRHMCWNSVREALPNSKPGKVLWCFLLPILAFCTLISPGLLKPPNWDVVICFQFKKWYGSSR